MRAAGRVGSRTVVAWLGTVAAAGLLVLLLVPPSASAHLERPSYWPDPAPDTSISPPAGGKVPKPRSLISAVRGKGAGEVFVVCRGPRGKRSMKILRTSTRRAVRRGWRDRPSQPREKLTRRQGKRLIKINRRLARQCEYRAIQEAVLDAGNNDRVIMMPGRYTEPASRAKPINDPRCAHLTQTDSQGRQTPSVAYHSKCPNDQNLIYVQGRAVRGEPPSPPLEDRHGIPDAGRCVRCNFEMQGSGVKAVDVVVDAGTPSEVGRGPEARPASLEKDVVVRVDRADGYVAKNFTVRGAVEHGLYVEEVDGYRIDTVKMFWNADYGNLSFTSDHGLYTNCDGYGSGDATIYPGATPETGVQAREGFYPDAPRYNTVVRNCDLRGSNLGYSGSMGNAVRITNNHVYGNGTGIASDTFSASGHPGFPLDSMKIDHNYIYSNNLHLYQEDPPVEPTVGVPTGVGILIAGGNDIEIHDNHIFDNWMRGTMLLAIPDPLVTPEGEINDGVSCPTAPLLTTSCSNKYYGNRMGQAPESFRFPPARAVSPFPDEPARIGRGAGGRSYPNGVDFWWDEWVGNTENCWFENTGTAGSLASLESDPAVAPTQGVSLPGFLPADCATSLGVGNVAKTAVLLECSMWSDGDTAGDRPGCDWFTAKSDPTTAAARRAERERRRELQAFEESASGQALEDRLDRFEDFVGAWDERP